MFLSYLYETRGLHSNSGPFNPYSMNIRAAIGNAMIKLGTYIGKPLTIGKVFPISTTEVYASLDSQTAVREGFDKNTPIYAIVMKDARKFGSIPRYVYSKEKKEEKAFDKIEQGKLTELLNRPNPFQSQDAFFTLERAYYKVCGESFVWLNRGDIEGYRLPDGSFDDKAIDRLPILEMYVLPSQYITLIPDPTNVWGVLGYILEAGERLVMRKGDVIHWKSTNLDFNTTSRDHLRGMSPLTPGSITAEEANSLAKTSLRRSQNDGAKGVLFNEMATTPQQQTDIKRVVDVKINNNMVADAVAAMAGKWGYVNLSVDNRANQTVELKKLSWQELCMLLDVPYEFFNPETTFANKEMAQVGWVTNSIVPACKEHDGEYNRVLPKAFGVDGKVFIGSDYAELDEVRKARVASAKEMQEIWSVTPNEVREFLDLEAYDDDSFDVPWVPGGRSPITHMQSPEDEMAQDLEIQRVAYEQSVNGRANGNGAVSKNGIGAKVQAEV